MDDASKDIVLKEDHIKGLVDVHAHLSWTEFDIDIEKVFENAQHRGVEAILLVSMDAEHCDFAHETCALSPTLSQECERMRNLALLAPQGLILGLAFGIHPIAACKSDVSRVIAELDRGDATGVGECGLDYTPRFLKEGALVLGEGKALDDVKEHQKMVLGEQIVAAVRLGLSLNVHSRSAGHHAITFVKEKLMEFEKEKRPRVLMHAFGGKAKFATAAVRDPDVEFYFSVAPSIVRDAGLVKLVQAVPLERLVLESDAPGLGPVLGERNEPMYVSISARAIALLKKVSVEDVARITRENAFKLFPGLAQSR